MQSAGRLLEQRERALDRGLRTRTRRGLDPPVRARRSLRTRALREIDEALVLRQAFGPRGGDFVRDRLALDVAHRDPENASILAGLVDGADARMVELGRDRGLATETFERGPVAARPRVEDLQRDLAAEARVLGEVDGRLPAAPELANDPVWADPAVRETGGVEWGSEGLLRHRVGPAGDGRPGRRYYPPTDFPAYPEGRAAAVHFGWPRGRKVTTLAG